MPNPFKKLVSRPLLNTRSFLSTVFCSFIFLILGVSSALAFEKDFPPYAKGKFPPHCKINPIKPSSESDRNKGNFKSEYRHTDQGRKLVLQLNMNYQKGTSGMYVSLKDSSGKTYVKPLKIGWHPSDTDKIYWAYLNKDKHKDFIINMDQGDGYLSGGMQKTTFLLSTKQGYTAKQIGVYNLQPEDFYDYSTDNKCEYLHQALVSTDKQQYWTYNILQFIDGGIVVKNQLSRYFPKWIKLAPAANDRAERLNVKQKKSLNQAYLSQIKNALNK